ncbi:protein ABIL1 isoform X2 [Silene latifolia]|uniref:protein ABIL1 isoform X2 n=1 Tax=Silene latifolia TaxID=37657 RepID=UPI003D786088
MEVEIPKQLPSSMTFDEVSMERSKSFVKALQELKNLRPQLYSAAEYCEKSYLHSEQKQMVLDNLKDYTVRALVNAVDHLGTVAYKLTDLVEQQTSDVSNMEVKVTCLNQKLLTCQTYMDKEGLRQQQLLAIIPRHHKRYILPNSVNKKVHFSPSAQADPRQMHVQARPRVHPADSPGSKTLSWHLTSDTKAPIRGPQKTVFSSEYQKVSPRSATVFHLVDTEDSTSRKSSSLHAQLPSGNSTNVPIQSYGVTQRDTMLDSKPMAPFRSSDNSRQAIVKAPLRRKSMLSAFFVKQKAPKLRSGTVS